MVSSKIQDPACGVRRCRDCGDPLICFRVDIFNDRDPPRSLVSLLIGPAETWLAGLCDDTVGIEPGDNQQGVALMLLCHNCNPNGLAPYQTLEVRFADDRTEFYRGGAIEFRDTAISGRDGREDEQ